DYFGYFSFVAQESDTLQFSAIGYANASFIIPDTLTTNKYSLIQVLRTDTVYLQTTEVYPWPTKEQFKQAFLKLEMPEDDLDRASRNMARADMKERMTGMAMDASLNYKYSMQQYQSKLYYAGQLPPNNLLNPIAWAKFIQAWKRGDYKKKN
ncbi:MAG: carboxypeptidase-like regulatory domain-containing protein, partial [Bacteroidia bacterium]|nr:carboxypeptidase-like regulatory domain-containing protein [Bacteroidia bacterium]